MAILSALVSARLKEMEFACSVQSLFCSAVFDTGAHVASFRDRQAKVIEEAASRMFYATESSHHQKQALRVQEQHFLLYSRKASVAKKMRPKEIVMEEDCCVAYRARDSVSGAVHLLAFI